MGISYQKRWVRPRGKKWHGCFRRTELDPETNETKLVTHSFVLGSKTEMSKSQAREKLEDEITKLGGRSTGDQSVVNGAVTFEWFVKNRYLPLKEGDWREETAKVKKYLIQADLIDAFGDYRLENFDKVILQTHLNKLAKIHSRDRVLQIRSYMRAIFAEAVEQDFIPKDPARKVRPPANLREVDKTALSWDQLRAALEKLGDTSLRDWILLKLDMSNALRPSELFPLRWRCFLEDSRVLDIQETVYKGKLRPFGKTKSSLTKVPIADVLAQEIAEYREECKKKRKDTSSDAFMFPGRFGGPMDSSNYRHRVLHKLARELELPKLTFQVIRRTIATLGKTKGHPKDIQGLMRHSRLATTMEVYMQSLQKEVRTAINSIHDELMATGTNGSEPQPPTVPEARADHGMKTSGRGSASRKERRGKRKRRRAARFFHLRAKCGQTVWRVSAKLLVYLVDQNTEILNQIILKARELEMLNTTILQILKEQLEPGSESIANMVREQEGDVSTRNTQLTVERSTNPDVNPSETQLRGDDQNLLKMEFSDSGEGSLPVENPSPTLTGPVERSNDVTFLSADDNSSGSASSDHGVRLAAQDSFVTLGRPSARYDRVRLYEEVWTYPLKTLALQYQVTYNAIGHACSRLNIPTPPGGYWQKSAAARQLVARPELPEVHFAPAGQSRGYADEERPPILAQVAQEVANGGNLAKACRNAGISYMTYKRWYSALPKLGAPKGPEGVTITMGETRDRAGASVSKSNPDLQAREEQTVSRTEMNDDDASANHSSTEGHSHLPAVKRLVHAHDREALYRAVWSKPMSDVAQDYGVPNSTISKWCKQLHIP